jgi:hypothetical protein
MPAEEELRRLVERIGTFHITDRAMKKAQRRIETALSDGKLDDEVCDAYLRAARRYFEAFDREARAHLRDVDRRLEHVNQVHFNLAAERGVAVKRIEGTASVLQSLAGFAGEPR